MASATTTQIYAVRTALIDLIEAHADTGVQVVRVTDISRDREGIFLGDSSTGNEDATGFSGGTRRRSQENIRHEIEAWAVDPDPATSERRATELAAVVEDILAEDPKLGGVPGLIAAYVLDWDLTVQMQDEHELITTVRMVVMSEVRKQ